MMAIVFIHGGYYKPGSSCILLTMSDMVSDFDYDLPINRIAQTPMTPREAAKLMVLSRDTGSIEHYYVRDLPSFFRAGDVVIVNNTKVFHARLHGITNGSRVELFLIRPKGNNQWLALGKPGKKFHVGASVTIAPDFIASVKQKYDDGTFVVSFPLSSDEVIEKANTYGEVPAPPYIKTIPKDEEYQTSYAKIVGSVAAPTAGFHLTKQIRDQLTKKGVTILEITLHVGIGTFMPIKSETLADHTMHSEWAHISREVAETITKAKNNKQRIIAIGTTTVRTLEGVAKINQSKVKKFSGDIDLFIKSGFRFQIVDAMLTNFHLPKSTLIVLVSAFAGQEHVLHAYKEAIAKKYRFYSFGDAMFIC